MKSLRDRKVLVTGAAGFIGAHIVRAALDRGAEVHAVVRPASWLGRIEEVLPRISLHRADMNDAAALKAAVAAARPEIVFNSAMVAGHPSEGSEREAMLRVSFLGTMNLLEASWAGGAERFIQLGSSLEYGPSAEPLREQDPPEPPSFRGAAKAAATLLCRQFARERSWSLAVLRLFSVYGPWEKATRFIPSAIRAALTGAELPLTPPGIRRDFIFVEDAVEGCLLAAGAEIPPGEVINVGTGEEHANEEVVALVERATGRTIRIRAGGHPVRLSDPEHAAADIRRARERLGWEPRHSLLDGVEKTIAWLRRNGLDRQTQGGGST